jgi:RNA polymerase sigma factor (sigma-70 family)
MTDREIVDGLLNRDSRVTHWFFYIKCRPLFLSLMKKLFKYPVEYDEFVDEVTALLLEKGEYRLRQFEYQSSICLWLRTTLIRHFRRNGNIMIEDISKEPLYSIEEELTDPISTLNAKLEIEMLLTELAKTNQRRAYVIKRILIDDAEFKEVADELGITTENLYNLKKRAFEDLTDIALNKNRNKQNKKK